MSCKVTFEVLDNKALQLKVSKSRKQIMMSLILLMIKGNIICFRDLLTFIYKLLYLQGLFLRRRKSQTSLCGRANFHPCLCSYMDCSCFISGNFPKIFVFQKWYFCFQNCSDLLTVRT